MLDSNVGDAHSTCYHNNIKLPSVFTQTNAVFVLNKHSSELEQEHEGEVAHLQRMNKLNYRKKNAYEDKM